MVACGRARAAACSPVQQRRHPPQRFVESIGSDGPDLLGDGRRQFAGGRREGPQPLVARVQHRLGVAVVADGPQWQAVRVAQPVDRAVDSRRDCRLVCSATCSCSSHSRTLRHARCGNPLDISYSIAHSTTLYERRFSWMIGCSGPSVEVRASIHAPNASRQRSSGS
jgi:hypothetical protein